MKVAVAVIAAWAATWFEDPTLEALLVAFATAAVFSSINDRI